MLKDEDRQLKKIKSARKKLLPNGYRTDLDQSNDLRLELASYYLHLIGILLLAMELRSIDIFKEVEVFSQYSVSL